MASRYGLISAAAAAALTMLTTGNEAIAQDRSLSREQIAAMVRENLPPALQNDMGGVVDNLLNVPLGTPLSKSFDPNKAAAQVFGRLPRSTSPDCLRKATPAGEADQGNCVVFSGQEGGSGAYLLLSYNKNMAGGNIKFLKRPPAQTLDPSKIPSVKLPDADADKNARQFLMTFFGLPASELAPTPQGTRLPVRSLLLGFDKKTGIAPIVLQKTVHLQRAFALAKPIPIPGTNASLTHVPGPGAAIVALDDSGVVGAAVADWRELRHDPSLSARNAKTPAELIQEIADDIFEEGGGPIASLQFQIMVGVDWRGSYGLLLPAVQVFVSPVARDPNEDQQRQLAGATTAGMVRQYALVKRNEADFETRNPAQ